MPEESLTAAGLESAIREFINEPRKNHLLREQRSVWSQVCASLDVIGDSQLAIDAYPIGEGERDKGRLYLWVYGLLQDCFVQQDAIRNLCEALRLKDSYKDFPQLVAVGELRNDAVGHPTNRKQRPPHRYCSISRISMSTAGFRMMVEEGESVPELRYVESAR